MLHLAIECSGIVGSVALWEAALPLARLELPNHQSSIQTLAATVQQLLAHSATRPAFLSVSSGPGSFTSLRVGLATAKMLAMAWDVPVVGVDSLAAIACRQTTEHPGQTDDPPHVIVPVINAFRKQVFASAWMTSGGGFQNLAQSQVVGASEWCSQPLESLQIHPNDRKISTWQHLPVVITGPGLANYTPSSPLPPSHTLADPSAWLPRAEEVAQLGWQAYQAGEAVSAAELTPNYVRASAAEEKLTSPRSPATHRSNN